MGLYFCAIEALLKVYGTRDALTLHQDTRRIGGKRKKSVRTLEDVWDLVIVETRIHHTTR